MCFSFVACQGVLHPSASLARAAQAAVACCVFRMSCTKNTVSVYIFFPCKGQRKKCWEHLLVWRYEGSALSSFPARREPTGTYMMEGLQVAVPCWVRLLHGSWAASSTLQQATLPVNVCFFFVARKTSVGSFSMVRVSPGWGASSLCYFLLCY